MTTTGDPGPVHPPLSGWNGSWTPHPPSIARLAGLAPGHSVTVVKHRPDGTEAARYPATVVSSHVSSPWVEVEAVWSGSLVDVAGLAFEPGDLLKEYFSPLHPFNAFAVIAPEGPRKGWYGNVTYPAFLLDDGMNPTLVWHDLYLDLVVLADGTVHLLDDDELDAAPAPFSDQAMHYAIHAARQDLLAFVRSLDV